MTLEQAYKYIFKILDNYYDKTHNDELGALLSGLNPHLFKKRISADPAAWDDWMDAVQKVTPRENITEDEARKAMLMLMKEYNDHHGFDLEEVIKYFKQQYPIDS